MSGVLNQRGACEDASGRNALPAAGEVGWLLLLPCLFFFCNLKISLRHKPVRRGKESKGGRPAVNKCVRACAI